MFGRRFHESPNPFMIPEGRAVGAWTSAKTGGLFREADGPWEIPEHLTRIAQAIRGLYRASYVPRPRKKEDKPRQLVWKPLRKDLTIVAPAVYFRPNPLPKKP